ncbi:histidinol-phosphate transaminase [Geomonas sp. Red32]|uniref:histidinol-phosphate transaminase n=1 Tax=Geomonas sp. Red32 TaxID=2912856 RepID=UPI00202CF2BC|nr:histidinol-phosphate transaminase [Geomonas sp. Red32]MCM0080457.1 histidinol-phosphate transaminase [Geomonas sp. Red32]
MIKLRKNIEEMAGYVPGFQPPDAETYIKLNTNENPYPPSPRVLEAIAKEVGEGLRRYPDAASRLAREEAGRVYGFDPSWIVLANGSDEVLNNLIRAFANEGEEIACVHPSYSYYGTLAEIQGARMRYFGLSPEFEIVGLPEKYDCRLFFLTNPNAPLGFTYSRSFIEELAGRITGVLVVDEAYVDFAEENSLDLVRTLDNVVVTRTFSKSYSLAGMRLGLAIARPEVIAALNKIRDHYNVDRLAHVAATAALSDQEYLKGCVAKIKETRAWFTEELVKAGYHVIPSSGNFVFASPPDGDGARLYQGLYDRKILVRHFSDPVLKHGMRITIGTREEMERTVRAMTELAAP